MLADWFDKYPLAEYAAYLGGLAAAALVTHLVARYLSRHVLGRIARETQFRWDDYLESHGVFRRIADLAPALVVYFGAAVLPLHERIAHALSRLSGTAVVILVALAVNGLLSALNVYYASKPQSRVRPIKGYVQIAQLLLFIVAAIVAVATLLDKSPWFFLSGIGAMTAVLMLVFKDTLLSFVASVQLAGNDMLRVDDWIEMPGQNADGVVIDIALHSVKVENWDKTVTTIPTYTLISQGFKNWRTMPLSGGRRIKRSIFVDAGSVRHLEDAEMERLRTFVLLTDYVDAKREDLRRHNALHAPEPGMIANARRLTNVGTFRVYVENYLRQHPGIHTGMTLMCRQLQPTPQGLPLEVYCFANRTDWVAYEAVQSDIFDHLFAIAPEFGLRVYQQPSGADVVEGARRLAAGFERA